MISTQPQMLLQKSLQHQDIPAGKALSEKAIKVAEFSTIFTDLSQYQKVLEHVELILDEIETELGSEKHLGPWLCGPTFSAADICLVSSVSLWDKNSYFIGNNCGWNFASFVELC
jgi:glutathione S-transferase